MQLRHPAFALPQHGDCHHDNILVHVKWSLNTFDEPQTTTAVTPSKKPAPADCSGSENGSGGTSERTKLGTALSAVFAAAYAYALAVLNSKAPTTPAQDLLGLTVGRNFGVNFPNALPTNSAPLSA